MSETVLEQICRRLTAIEDFSKKKLVAAITANALSGKSVLEVVQKLQQDSHPATLTVPAAEMERVIAGFSAEIADLRKRIALLEQDEEGGP